MTDFKHNKQAALTIGYACAVALAVLLAGSSGSAPIAAAAGIQPKVSPRFADSKTGDVLITVFLSDNSFLAKIPERAERLLAQTQGTAEARSAARRSPAKLSDAESVAASIAESSRNAAVPMIRRAAKSGSEQAADVRALIEQLGGRYVSASPFPSQITAYLSATRLARLAEDERILKIEPGRLPALMNAPIDGSSTWWAGGFRGQGSSADGNGSPDVVVFDTGIRTTHTAFKSRLPGDGPTQDGSGATRVTSPVGRSSFGGSKHANTIAAEVAGTALYSSSGGIAYGLDKLYDPYQAASPYYWMLGITQSGDPGLAGTGDLPEVINYSAGIYEDTTDLNPSWAYFDALESEFGILASVSGGNCGTADPSYTNCGSGPHRISTPGNTYNVITVGGLDTTTLYPDTSGYFPWEHTSPGPTYGGRKKPDVIAPVFGTAGTPSQIDDNTWTSGGDGTSYAAPIAGAGAVLMASAGIYSPTAQKALMINSATPVQGQTYWTPRAGWGALNLSNAYAQRGNYVSGTVTGVGANSARFFEVTGLSSGDRSTLVWNRRTAVPQINSISYYNLTDLDLSQFAAGDPDTPTATGGSDANETPGTAASYDTDQTVSVDNPMPGNGVDGEDNVEQVRSTGTGTQILKVKALSSVDGASSEPFSIASAGPVSALTSPIPSVTVDSTSGPVAAGEDITVSATITNPSTQLSLNSAEISLDLPAGAALVAGSDPNPKSLSTIGPSGTATATWTVQGSTTGNKVFSATTSGTTFGEGFSGSGSAETVVDATPPVVNLAPAAAFSTTANPQFTWSATDADSAVDTYDIDTAIDNAPWSPLLGGTTSTSVNVPAAEGQTIHLRVRARDTVGNASDWSETQTTIDAVPPEIKFGAEQRPGGGIVRVPVSVTNVGAPIVKSSFTFATSAGGNTGALSPVVSFRNTGDETLHATLDIFVIDGAGRTTKASQNYSVPPRWRPLHLKITKLKAKRRKLTVSGTLASAFDGKVTVTVKRRGRVGTKKVTKTLRNNKGGYTTTLRLRRGAYRVTVSTRTVGDFKSRSTSKNFSVR